MINKPSTLLISTYNSGKLREIASLLANLPIELKDLNDLPGITEVEETGKTIWQNAELKAIGYALQSNMWSLADDTGLEVAALDGAPGVFSDRYAGEGASDLAKMEKLLHELDNIPNAPRRAQFVCVMSIADAIGSIAFTSAGICDGSIANEPRGTNGFGYDPIFIPDGFDATFGELEDNIKQQISHRARAIAEIIRYLHGFLEV
jgi:non-canonical purine NTP pyrophosphatase, rdgB/HAM1 family